MLTTFVLPDNAIASTTTYITDIFTDLLPFFILIIGMALAFWFIRSLISLILSNLKRR